MGAGHDLAKGTKAKVPSLKCRTMSLDRLQKETLRVLRLARKQFNRAAYEDGLSDNEFIREVLEPLMHSIRTDRAVIRMRKRRTT